MELPVFNAFTTLFTGVARGLVDGTIAATTPFGRKNSLTPVTGLSSTKPKLFCPLISRKSPNVLRWFLVILSPTLPSPVSATAKAASSALRDGSINAHAAAAAALSKHRCEPVASYRCCAARARSTRLSISGWVGVMRVSRLLLCKQLASPLSFCQFVRR